MNRPQVRIRQPSIVDDWRAVRRLCCATGRDGAPIEDERRDFFAEHWIGPYQRLEPGWAFVAEHDGAIVGYLTGCPETRAFERRKALFFAPGLIFRALSGRYQRNADVRRFLRRTLRLEKSPERRFPPAVRTMAAREYPVHLHVNVDANIRSLGVGRLLIERFSQELRRAGVPGVHVYCGPRPVPFYTKLGFTALQEVTLPSGAVVYLLGLKL